MALYAFLRLQFRLVFILNDESMAAWLPFIFDRSGRSGKSNADVGNSPECTRRLGSRDPSQLRSSSHLSAAVQTHLTDDSRQVCDDALDYGALRSRCGHYISALWFLLLSFFLLSSPNLSRRRLDVCHTSTLWCGLSANLRRRSETCCTRLAEIQDAKNRQKFTISAPSHNFVGLYLCNSAVELSAA